MKTKLLITGILLMASTAIVSAQQCKGHGCGRNNQGKGMAYTDKNNNSICDNAENKQSVSQKKGNGAGICNGTGQGKKSGNGKHKNFVDANKNGICDLFEKRS